MTSRNVRLDETAWINAALDVLAEHGIESVRVEPLAKRLGVTKGSFYWHFKDRDALYEALLNDWRRRATLDVIARIETFTDAPDERIRRFMTLPFHGSAAKRGADIELSIRLWARSDPRARRALQEVDELRLRNMRGLLAQLGFNETQAAARAVQAYSFIRVAGALLDATDKAVIEHCVDLVTAPVGAEHL